METKVIYVEHLIGTSNKSGEPYNMLKLSNGLESKVFTTTVKSDVTSDIEQGTEITVTFEMDGDPFSYRGIQSVITSIE